MSKLDETPLADLIYDCFSSPNVMDNNGEAANVVDALDKIGSALHRIADAFEDHVERETEG